MVIQRTPLTQSLLELDAELLRLLQQLSPPQTRPTEMLGQIAAPSHPSQPREWLILAVAAMLGLMGGMAAFVTEFVANAKAFRPTPT
jgi:LPS O-antigen subunit length determinant protein (WzzB/FepE family)